jgi:hypothetical protein
MQTSNKNTWLDQVRQLFETGNYLRALDVIGNAMKEFPGDEELEQMETLAWSGLGKRPGAERLFGPEEQEALKGSREPSFGTKTLLDLIEDRRRDRMVEACLCQARWLKSENDIAGALRALDSGLNKFPHETRLMQLRDSLEVVPEPVKVKEPEPVNPKEPEPDKFASPDTNIPLADGTPEERREPVALAARAVECAPLRPVPVESPPEPPRPARSAEVTRPPVWAGVGTAVAILLIVGAVRSVVAPKAHTVIAPFSPQQAVLESTASPAGATVRGGPNTGTLVVQANQNGATITVLAGRTEVARGQTKNRSFRLPNLHAQRYVVRAAKEGYYVDPSEQSADIQLGEDKTVAFAFRRKPQAGSVRIHLTEGCELFADGKTIPAVAGDTYTVTDLKPGTHMFRAQKKQFLPNQETVEVVAGQSSEIDLRLAAAPIPVEIKRAPADSYVTYIRAGDPAVHTFTGDRRDLPEGDYTFTARAKGYRKRVQEIHISWNFAGRLDLAESATIAEWGKVNWKENRGWYSRKGGGIIYFPMPLGTGSVEFAVHWQSKGHAQWILNASDRSYLQCELDDEGFQVFRVTDEKTRVPMGKKKPVAKTASYTIRIEIKSEIVTHKLQRDGAWETLDSLQDTAPAAGKFGFNIPNRQELFLANFIFQPDR